MTTSEQKPRRRRRRGPTPTSAPSTSGADDSSGSLTTGSKRPRRKRRDRPAPSSSSVTLDADGRERPGFLLSFPDDPDLNELVAAFERGDYRRVRERAPQVAESSRSRAVRRAAEELRSRLDPDPAARVLLWIAVGLFAFLVIWSFGSVHSH